jgi:cytochrome c-type biogenesis protein CcmH/NrfF
VFTILRGSVCTRRTSQSLIFLCLLFSAVALSGVAAAEDAQWGYQLSHELMSPFCPGRTLAACSSPQAADMRVWIVEQEAAGRSEAEVKAELYQSYGEIMRASPLASGGGQWAYIIPVVLILLGAAVVVFFLKRQRGGADGSATGPLPEGPPVEEDPELARIVDQELSS